MDQTWSAETCFLRKLKNSESQFIDTLEIKCPVVWDGFLCWGSAQAGATVNSSCPFLKGLDITKTASRVCGDSGEWLNKHGMPTQLGWTNYTLCFTPEISEIIEKLGSSEDAQVKINVAKNTRMLEFIGLGSSLMALLISLLFFYCFRKLQNSSTRLHRHLFFAMLIQVVIRLIVYTDQAITRPRDSSGTFPNATQSNVKAILNETYSVNQRSGIDNTPIICEASYIMLEYARTAMFMWMFAEGIFLHNRIAGTVFEENISPLVYPFLGWILPIPLTACWATFTHFHYGAATCWWGYNFTLYFWILEGPRLAVLLVKTVFKNLFLKYLHVAMTKVFWLYGEVILIFIFWKAVKAALTLLPLFGLTNLLNMIAAPLESSTFVFACWSYTTHVLTSTQGLMLAILYCFRNGEVQLAVQNLIRRTSSSLTRDGNGTRFFEMNSVGLHRQGAVIRRDYHYDRPTAITTTYI